MNEAGRAGGQGAGGNATNINVSGSVPQINAQTQALQEQTQTIVPLNEQWEKYSKEMSEVQKASLGYVRDMTNLSDIVEEYNKHTNVAKVNTQELNKAMGELFKGNTKELYDLLNNFE